LYEGKSTDYTAADGVAILTATAAVALNPFVYILAFQTHLRMIFRSVYQSI
jgi:hypothetical protein